MWRRALQVAAALLCLHAMLTFAFAVAVFPGSPLERLVFAQHGFNFVFLAMLNLALLHPLSPRLRTAVIGVDLLFCANSVVLVVLKPEPPHVIAAVITLIATVAAFGLVRAVARTA